MFLLSPVKYDLFGPSVGELLHWFQWDWSVSGLPVETEDYVTRLLSRRGVVIKT